MFHAFNEAKAIAMKRMAQPAHRAARLVPRSLGGTGADPGPRPLGIRPFRRNRHTLETLAGYSHEQGLTKRRMPLDELFSARFAGPQARRRIPDLARMARAKRTGPVQPPKQLFSAVESDYRAGSKAFRYRASPEYRRDQRTIMTQGRFSRQESDGRTNRQDAAGGGGRPLHGRTSLSSSPPAGRARSTPIAAG